MVPMPPRLPAYDALKSREVVAVATHQGATTRRNVPKPAIAMEPQLVVNCICCHCEAVFHPEDVAGGYLDRRCPECGEIIDEASYDAAERALAEGIQPLREEKASARADARKWETWAHRFRWKAFGPIRGLFNKRAQSARRHEEDLRLKLSARKRRISAYASSRYYTGEWYLRTRIPLTRTVVAPYRIKVGYDKVGTWYIRQTDKETAGIVGEFEVFQKLLTCVRDASSPLYQAQIVPNVYFPSENGGKRRGSYWSQVDDVLLTRQAAFVIEVKRRGRHIVAPAPFEEIWSTASKDLADDLMAGRMEDSAKDARLRDESKALRQNSQHAVAFSDTCSTYPFERVYEQVVYVGMDSFGTDCRRFDDNVNVSSLGGDSDFAAIIGDECRNLGELVDQDALARLGESLLASYGDLNQKRGQIHVRRLQGIHGK